MAKGKYDFSGWATRNNIKCSDGRVIMRDAFKHNDGQKVPLVWNHLHNDPTNILGHAMLENRPEGVYAYGTFNDTEAGRQAKLLVQHGDISSLSIYANHLQQKGDNVLHGAIREVSLVLAGANQGAFIDAVISHGDELEDEFIMSTGDKLSLSHADTGKPAESSSGSEDEETVEDVFNTLTDKQKTVVYALIGQAVEDANSEASHSDNDEDEEGEETTMKHNVFDNDQDDQAGRNVIKHSDEVAIFDDIKAKRFGSLKDAVLAHGIENIDYLFPDAKTMNSAPDFISRPTEWVQRFMGGVHHTPFARIKSVHADITEDEARAKGYIKGKQKVDEVFTLLKRTTTPTTVYKKQKLERDDVIDITDFDVVAWMKTEMRMMLDEEIARAALVGDGRLGSSDDKINPLNIRPIWTDDDLYTVKVAVHVAANASEDERAQAFIRAVVKSRKNYKGSGSPVLWTTEDTITSCLLLTDTTGRDIYESVEKLKSKLRVSDIIAVPVMEGLTRSVEGVTHSLMGIIVNLTDYNIGADKGGAVNMFDDFDIDFNAQKYLIETRCSGALTKPFSAMAVELIEDAAG